MFLSDISVKRPIMMSMFLIVFVLFGGLAYFGLSLDLMPRVDIPFVTITTIYPGAGPQEIETQISKKLEDAVSTISQIKETKSFSMESVSLVMIEFQLGKDVDIATQETKDKVDAILNDLPDDAEKPIIEKFEVGADPVVDVVLDGNLSRTELFELADKRIKDQFAQVNGVAKVDIVGGQEREIVVELDNKIVAQNILSVPQIAQIVAAENMDMPGGHFTRQSQEYSARLKGKFESVEEMKNLEISTPFGIKKLGKLAKIYDSGEEIRERSTYYDNVAKEGKDNIVLLSIIKSTDGNTVQLAKDIKEIIPEIAETLPAGCNLKIVNDNSVFIESSVEDTLSNIGLGIILTALVLLFFLHDWRSTIIAAMSMPFSIISTFMLMQWAGFNLNIMTLMGLSTSVGVLVANSVVVLENIFRHKGLGLGRKEAATKGTAEIVVAVLASTLTNIVVFLPIASMSSIVGQFFEEFALTVTFATIFSLIVSFTLTPMMASLIIPEHSNKKRPLSSKLEKLFESWERLYKRMLEVVIKNKLTSFGTVVLAILMFIGSFFFASQVGFEFTPKMDEGDISVEVELPQGYSLDQTALLIKEVEEVIVSHDEVKQVLTTLGKVSDTDKGTNLAKVQVKLVDATERNITTDKAASLLIEELSNIPNAIIRVAAQSSAGSGMAPIAFYLQGSDNEKLESFKTNLIEKFKTIPGLINLNTSSRSGKPEITLKPDRDKLSEAGLTVSDLAFTLRAAMEGLEATRFADQGEEYDIRVTMNDESVDSPEKIANLTVVSRKGAYRMAQLADIDFTEGYSKVVHVDKIKSIQFTANVADGFVLGNITNQITSIIDEYDLPAGYKIKWAGDARMMNEAMADMARAFLIAIILTYMLLAAILESLTQPFLILGTVPLALIGVFVSLFMTGTNLSISAMMAIIMLIGIVVNNAILIIDYANLLVKEGKGIKEALLEAAPTKLKPILMSTIAIMLGMLPMAMGIGSAGKEFREPMGIVSIGGLLVSMILTLFVIPALYQLTQRKKSRA